MKSLQRVSWRIPALINLWDHHFQHERALSSMRHGDVTHIACVHRVKLKNHTISSHQFRAIYMQSHEIPFTSELKDQWIVDFWFNDQE